MIRSGGFSFGKLYFKPYRNIFLLYLGNKLQRNQKEHEKTNDQLTNREAETNTDMDTDRPSEKKKKEKKERKRKTEICRQRDRWKEKNNEKEEEETKCVKKRKTGIQ